jgi:hypothetical protein
MSNNIKVSFPFNGTGLSKLVSVLQENFGIDGVTISNHISSKAAMKAPSVTDCIDLINVPSPRPSACFHCANETSKDCHGCVFNSNNTQFDETKEDPKDWYANIRRVEDWEAVGRTGATWSTAPYVWLREIHNATPEMILNGFFNGRMMVFQKHADASKSVLKCIRTGNTCIIKRMFQKRVRVLRTSIPKDAKL